MDPKEKFREILREGALRFSAEELTLSIERPANPEHGDYASNIALQLSKRLRRNPRQIAEEIAKASAPALAATGLFEPLTVAGAGFLNIRVKPEAKLEVIRQVLEQGKDYGRVKTEKEESIQIEFVSANPTGPLHVGHGRGAAYGDSLAKLLEFAGARVTREFYVNDAGRQMDILALSVWLRYLQMRNMDVPFPEEGYRGDYVRDIAARLADENLARKADFSGALPDADAEIDRLIDLAKRTLGDGWKRVHRFALEAMLADQREDLAAFRVSFDQWSSEQALHDNGLIDKALRLLQARGHLFEQGGALWFRSSAFGDEKDRVVRRENGQYTYFASDIAYHLDKFERGFDRVIDVWGADHHGYVPRVKGALEAFGLDPGRLEIALVQFAVLYRNGEKLAMGKRSGEFVTLRELREEVGNDAARFFYVLRKSDQHLDFDLDLAKSESSDNPVYYVQYAHARVCSVFAQIEGWDFPKNLSLEPLKSDRELLLAQRLAEFPELILTAARERAPHSLAFYLRELAAEFHSYYNAERILVDDETLRSARLALSAAVRQTLANGLSLLGVSAPEKM
ncbi:MAG: arginine--tRNA ligase [Betaproteobacteria bacterium]|nr:MAG: arginine--tRNA ligase [Betaproteobacteria bacterium]